MHKSGSIKSVVVAVLVADTYAKVNVNVKIALDPMCLLHHTQIYTRKDDIP
jgi:hypothetical protein